jgi:hypothetical protein
MVMRRIDRAHQQQLKPHINLIPEADLLRIRGELASADLNPGQLVRELQPYPEILNRVFRAANAPINGRIKRIAEPLQAVAWLGSRKLSEVLEQIPDELIQRAG